MAIGVPQQARAATERGHATIRAVIEGGAIARRGATGATSRAGPVQARAGRAAATDRPRAPVATVMTVVRGVTKTAEAQPGVTTRVVARRGTREIATATAVASAAATTDQRARAVAGAATAPAVMVAKGAAGAKELVMTTGARGATTRPATGVTAVVGVTTARAATVEAATAMAAVAVAAVPIGAQAAATPAAEGKTPAVGAATARAATIETAVGAEALVATTAAHGATALAAMARMTEAGVSTPRVAMIEAAAGHGATTRRGPAAERAARARKAVVTTTEAAAGVTAPPTPTDMAALLAATIEAMAAHVETRAAGVATVPTLDVGPPMLTDREGIGPARAVGSSVPTATHLAGPTIAATAGTARGDTRSEAATATVDHTTGTQVNAVARHHGVTVAVARATAAARARRRRARAPVTFAKAVGRTTGQTGVDATPRLIALGRRIAWSGRHWRPPRRSPTRLRRLRWTLRPVATSSACRRMLPRRSPGISSRPERSSTTIRRRRSPTRATRGDGRHA